MTSGAGMFREVRTLWTLRRLARDVGGVRRRRNRTAFVVVYVAALSLFVLHGAFHVWGDAMLLGYGPANPLGWLLGPSDVGHVVHVLEFAIVVLALFLSLWRALREEVSPRSLEARQVASARMLRLRQVRRFRVGPIVHVGLPVQRASLRGAIAREARRSVEALRQAEEPDRTGDRSLNRH